MSWKEYERSFKLKELGLNIIDFSYLLKHCEKGDLNDMEQEKEILLSTFEGIKKDIEKWLRG